MITAASTASTTGLVIAMPPTVKIGLK